MNKILPDSTNGRNVHFIQTKHKRQTDPLSETKSDTNDGQSQGKEDLIKRGNNIVSIQSVTEEIKTKRNTESQKSNDNFVTSPDSPIILETKLLAPAGQIAQEPLIIAAQAINEEVVVNHPAEDENKIPALKSAASNVVVSNTTVSSVNPTTLVNLHRLCSRLIKNY